MEIFDSRADLKTGAKKCNGTISLEDQHGT
jgi:hypothetical protein